MAPLREFKIPYGSSFQVVKVPEEQLLGIFLPQKLETLKNPGKAAREVIRQGLEETQITVKASPACRVAIGITDRTRVTPHRLFLPLLLNELNGLGVPDENITIIVGTGMHAPDSVEDIRRNVGEEIQRRIRIINNHPLEKDLYTRVGQTSYGTPINLHREFAAADIKIVTGNIIPCLMAGWTGGGKTLLPGVVDRDCIYFNHKFSMDQLLKANRGAMLGVLPPENIVRDDIEEAATRAGLDMAVNSVLNFDETLVQVLAGEHREIHREGVNTALKGLEAPFPGKADIIIGGVGNLGFDISLYQGGSRVLQSLDEVIKEGGTIIFTCECREGIYEGIMKDVYTDWMQQMPTPEEIVRLMEEDTLPPEDGVVIYVFSWIIHKLKCNVVVVTEGLTEAELKAVHMNSAPSLQHALDAALDRHGAGAQVAVLPYASMMMPRLTQG